jgi:hypothetical protein
LADDIDSYWDIPRFRCAQPDVIFIVNGEDVAVVCHKDEPFTATIAEALKKSQNTGRPFDAWDLRNLDGKYLDSNQTPTAYGIVDGERFFLTLKIGVGGNFNREAA